MCVCVCSRPHAGNVVEAVCHARTIRREINVARSLSSAELYGYAKQLGVPLDLLKKTAELGRLPVVNFAAGGLGEDHVQPYYCWCLAFLEKRLKLISSAATPADVGLLMQLGVDGVFVGSGIFKSTNPEKRARAMVQAVTHYNDPSILAKVSEDLGEAMVC